MKKHHPVNYSVSKDDAGSSEGSGGATHLQRLFQALKGLTGDTRGAQELVDCWATDACRLSGDTGDTGDKCYRQSAVWAQ
jgi:hypothetical protein